MSDNHYTREGESALDLIDNLGQRYHERFAEWHEDRREDREAKAAMEFHERHGGIPAAPHGVDEASWESANERARDDAMEYLDYKAEWQRQFREAYWDGLEADLRND